MFPLEQLEQTLSHFRKLTSIPSPTGMTRDAENYVLAELTRMGYVPVHERKGTVIVHLGGSGHPLLMTAHLDTLGAVVRSIKPNGCLRYQAIGGWNDNSIENENVLIHTVSGKVFTGTVQSVHASRHVWGDTTAEPRSNTADEIVLDEKVTTKEATEALGIRAGDMVSFDPRTVVTESGFVKSRHIDDKAAAAMLLTLAEEVANGNITLGREVILAFTVYEEIGHGASSLGKLDVEDMIAIDMGCVGDDLNAREWQVSICAKDRIGPYDRALTTELIRRSEALGIDYAVDVYPMYSSDAATALHAGLDARFACFGMATFASHGYERTHVDALRGCLKLMADVVSHA